MHLLIIEQLSNARDLRTAQLSRCVQSRMKHSHARMMCGHTDGCAIVSFRVPTCAGTSALLGPPRLDGATHHLAALLGADIAPACSTQPDCLSLYRIDHEPSARYVENLEREIEERFGWEIGLAHDPAQTHRAPNAEQAHEFLRQKRAGIAGRWCA